MKKEITNSTLTPRGTRSRRPIRSTTGNFLVLSSVIFAVACVALIMGYSFASLFFVNNRLQTSADEIALAGAKKLNDKDRIGQVNNMVARCRQLVYSSRQDYDDTKKFFPDLENFAEPLLQEARDSAANLEKERQNIARLAESEATQAMQQRFNDIKNTYPMTLPWLRIQTPQLAGIKFGKIDEMESNVEELKAFADLGKNDESQAFVVLPAPALPLYKGDLPDGMRLPTTDSDLTFKLSSLPAPVDNIIAPARVILPGKLKTITTGSVPSVARVKLQLQVETALGFKAGAKMGSVGVASTTGACPQE